MTTSSSDISKDQEDGAFPVEVMAHGPPQVIADIVAFLVSDEAALVSGAIVPAYGN
jgi:NAD(P)-dependent dehydrogenase (short-subunit alcohol dehydrogenase family)